MAKRHEEKAAIMAVLMAADISSEPHWEAIGSTLANREDTVKDISKLADLIIKESRNESNTSR